MFALLFKLLIIVVVLLLLYVIGVGIYMGLKGPENLDEFEVISALLWPFNMFYKIVIIPCSKLIGFVAEFVYSMRNGK